MPLNPSRRGLYGNNCPWNKRGKDILLLAETLTLNLPVNLGPFRLNHMESCSFKLPLKEYGECCWYPHRPHEAAAAILGLPWLLLAGDSELSLLCIFTFTHRSRSPRENMCHALFFQLYPAPASNDHQG